ncbi:DUF294 nucleotidyltransferase-like domain-containing protein [Anoxybacillus flavithermus]|uniref:Signal transduction protein n=1 Tax=Anoxybacillus flavithermus AK1 TaxID=1297581 RepID=M8D7J0_9BACL|nr:DUF294 nucleotidyltransferase-like domain-containing protein [Anoxybacillus flavithermus]EMT46766.1 hypothetical protein H919_03912 [Anoxybacillus flavithermus AK1]
MHPLFSGLPKEEIDRLIAICERKTFEKDDAILGKNERRKGLVLLLDGVAEVYVEHEGYDEVLEVVQKGGLIGFSSLADFLGVSKGEGKEELVAVRAAERCEVLIIPFSVLSRLWDDPNVHDYLLAQACVRLKDVYVSLAEQIKQARKFGDSTSFVVPVQDLMVRDVVTLPPTATVQEAAKKMAETHISSIIVTEEKKLCGIVTETDLVERVLSCSLPYDTAIERVMTKDVATISRFAYYYDALAMMIERGVKHLPVVDDEKVQGIVTFSDLMRKKNESMMRTIQQIDHADERTLPKMKMAIYELLGTMLRDQVPIAQCLNMVTKLYDRLVLRCMALALNEVGEPPCRFAFYQMGSSGRREQFLLTDQDHFLVYESDEHAAYFAKLGEAIVRVMEKAGYERCKGKMMASEKAWRGSLETWKDRLREWMIHATNDNLLLAQNFFSYRFVYGDMDLHRTFEQQIREQLTRAKIFFFRLVEIEKQNEIPTLDRPIRSIFGLERKTIDMKKEVLFPYHHSVQILSLIHGIVSGTPFERIEKLKEKHVLSPSFAKDVQKAAENVLAIYIRHKWNHYKANKQASSVLSFTTMTTREKDELILSLKTLKQLQAQLFSHF